MTTIKTITGLPVDPKRLEREEASQRVRQSQSDSSQEQKSTISEKPVKDTVKISSLGRKYTLEQSEVKRYLEEFAQTRTLDDNTVQVIREKIASGFYSKPEVFSKVAEELSQLPGFSKMKLAAARKSDHEKRSTGLDAEGLSNIKQKINDDAYESEEVLTEIVERLLKDIKVDE